MTSLYQAHLMELARRYEDAMLHFDIEAIVLASGMKSYYFQDDHTHPFRAYSGAQQWLPFSLSTETYVILMAGEKPTLIWPIRDDFWHAPNLVPKGDWQQNWNIIEAKKTDKWFADLPTKTAWLGPEPMPFVAACKGLKTYVDFAKAVKTPYEVDAIQRASNRAVKGHIAAKEAFLAGMSELDIHLAFLQASQQTAAQEPNPGIIGLNEHAAV